MKIKRYCSKKDVNQYIEIGEPKYLTTWYTGDGMITLIYAEDPERHCWNIYEYSVGKCIIDDIGRLTKQQFQKIGDLIVFLGSKKIIDVVKKEEVVNK